MKNIYAATLKLFAGGIFLGFLAGCNALDPAEDIPSYLRINSISLSTSGNQGSSTSDITDAWIFMDGALIGAFELPCNVPILAEGTHRFIIRGGVKMNGLASTRAIYPAWKGWEGSVTLTRGQSTTASPVVTYFPAIDFGNTWMLDFDLQGTSLTPQPTSSAIIVKDTFPNAFEGPYSGLIRLNNTDTTFFYGASSSGYLMPATVDTWVEFDYRCNAPFTIGILNTANTSQYVEWLAVLPNTEWTKIYVRISDPLAEALATMSDPRTTPYKIYFAMANPTSQSESHLYLDNIKLLK